MAVAQYDRLHGPVRDTPHGPHCRQPVIERWLVTDEAFREVEKVVGSLRLRDEFVAHELQGAIASCGLGLSGPTWKRPLASTAIAGLACTILSIPDCRYRPNRSAASATSASAAGITGHRSIQSLLGGQNGACMGVCGPL